jgi:hypothetical protein
LSIKGRLEMPYIAFEFDHRIGMHTVRWLVMECAGEETKFGGPFAAKPRRDIAYFVDPDTAEADARAFAEYRESLTASGAGGEAMEIRALADSGEMPSRHIPYEWDHTIYREELRWAVLKWSGAEEVHAPREDVAYFIDPETAEEDARAFAFIRDRE